MLTIVLWVFWFLLLFVSLPFVSPFTKIPGETAFYYECVTTKHNLCLSIADVKVF